MKKLVGHVCTTLLVGAIGYLCGALLLRPVYYDMTYQGVHVCLSQHFDQKTLRCTQDDWVFTRNQVADIHISYTGPNGGRFTDMHSTIELCCDYFPDGYIVGQLTQGPRLGSHVLAARLSQIAQHLHARTDKQSFGMLDCCGPYRYKILVFNGRTDRGAVLGTAIIAVV